MASLGFRRYHHPALATTEQSAERARLIFGFVVRPPVPFEDVLHLIKQTLGNDGFVLALIYLPAIPEQAAIERIGKNTGDPVPMIGVVGFGEKAMLGEKRRYILQAGIILGVQLKSGLDDFRRLPVHHNRFRARVVEVADGGKRRELTALHFFIEASFCVRGQVEDVLVGDAELHAHHQNVVGRVIAPVVRLDMPDDAPLQKPAHLTSVHRIAGEPIQFPADDAGCLAGIDPFHHLVEHGAAGHFRRLLFHELQYDMKPPLFRQSTQDGELVFDGAHLLVFNVG